MKHGHTMKAVARRTGLSPQLIRMWERRYQAVVPDRTTTGRRIYSDDDINRLALLKRATLVGESIGQIAGLSDDDLVRLVEDSGVAVPVAEPSNGSGGAEHYLQSSLRAIEALDARTLESILLGALASMGQGAFLQQVVTPLLTSTGDRWAEGRLKVAHEHLVSAVVRSMLGGMILTHQTDDRGPAIVLTTPSGQHHELGILMASVTASSAGWRPVYLGPNMPAEEIASSAGEKQARAVGLSLIYPSDDTRLPIELKKLARLLPDDTTLIAGGQALEGYGQVLSEIDAIHVHDLSEFRHHLDRLRGNK